LFKRLAKVEMTHIPYRGGAPAINDLIPGRVDVIFDNMPSILSHVKAGSLRGLAVTTKERVAVVPEIPTIAESGVPGFDVFSWFGFFVPVRTPQDVIARLNADTNAALVHASVKTRFEELGANPKGSTPAELAAFLKSEIDKWARSFATPGSGSGSTIEGGTAGRGRDATRLLRQLSNSRSPRRG